MNTISNIFSKMKKKKTPSDEHGNDELYIGEPTNVAHNCRVTVNTSGTLEGK